MLVQKRLYIFTLEIKERKKAMFLEELENDPNPYKGFKKEYISDIKNPAYVVEEESKEVKKGSNIEKIIIGGRVIAWNEEFERLANFTPSDIEDKSCHELFRAVVWNDETYAELSITGNLKEEFQGEINSTFRNKIKYSHNKLGKLIFKDALTDAEKGKLGEILKKASLNGEEIEKILKKSDCTKRWLQICSEDCAIRKKDPAKAGVIKKLWINSKDLKGGDIKKCVDVFIFPFMEDGKKCALHILSSREEAYSHRHFSEDLIRKTKRSVKIEDIRENVDCSYLPIKENDVYKIQNPAYVVKAKLKKEGKEEEEKEKEEKERGCVVAWNEEFERLTNFTPSDIDYKWCDRLFDGCWENNWQQICIGDCPIRGMDHPVVIRDFWINSKDQRGGDIKRRVDVFVFPFKREQNIFTLHILLDTEIAHDYQYFLKDIAKRI